MFLEDLKIIKDNELLTRFSTLVQKEREAIADVVFYLSEIARRKLYLEDAYSSLFSFVTQKFHYSEGAAYRRIQAAKVSQLYPQVLELLSQGKVSLMTVSLIEPHLTKENAERWIEKIIGKSKREVEFMLSELSLKRESHRDTIRRLPVFRIKEEGDLKDQSILSEEEKRDSDLRQEKLPAPLKVPGSFSCLPSSESKTAQSYTITGESGSKRDEGIFTAGSSATPPVKEVRKIKVEFVAKEELAQKIERAKEILRHKFPDGKFEDIFNQALEDMLDKRDPERKIERMNKKSEKMSEKGEKMKREDKNKSTKEVRGEKELEPVRPLKKDEKGEKPSFSRHIPEQVRRVVFERDHGQCRYESPDGRRCGERNFIEVDHIQPWALGGESIEENLRTLCAKHNQWRAEKTFGKWK